MPHFASPLFALRTAIEVGADDGPGVLDALTSKGYRIVPLRRLLFDNRPAVIEDGLITSRVLIQAANEFDSIEPGQAYGATDFVAWLMVEVRGTPEADKWPDRRPR